jgi:hypothetical protein
MFSDLVSFESAATLKGVHVMKMVTITSMAVALILSMAVADTTFAQDDATPTAGKSELSAYSFDGPYSPDPELCTATPTSTDLVANLLATPVAVEEPALTSNGIVSLPSGSPANDTITSSVIDTLTQLWACNNAANSAAILGLMTDDAIQQTFGTDEPSTDFAELRGSVAELLTPGDPRTSDDLASIDAIVSILDEGDGHIGALVLNSDPRVADGSPVLDYFQFEQQGDIYEVSRIVLDPFDLTTGYGFEAA